MTEHVTDTAYRTLSDILDIAALPDRQALLGRVERASLEDPRPWLAALRRLRVERAIAPPVTTYLLHVLTNGYAFARALGDPEMANLAEGLRMVVLRDYGDEDEVLAELSTGKMWAHRDVEARAIRDALFGRRPGLEQAIVRELGEEEHAEALADLPRVLDACEAGRVMLMGPSWPCGFGDALRASRDLPIRERAVSGRYSFDVKAAPPREVLLEVLDRSSRENRRDLACEIQLLAETNPYPWLDALRELWAGSRMTADERFLLGDAIAVFHLFELLAADGELTRLRAHATSLAGLYGVPRLDPQFCEEWELIDLPEELAVWRAQLWARQHRYAGAALREMGEHELADSYTRRESDAHFGRLHAIEEELFGGER